MPSIVLLQRDHEASPRLRALVVPTKAERVHLFHQNTLKALKELVQAAGLSHPGAITASHIVRRCSDHQVKLLTSLLPFVKPGQLLSDDMPHNVFRMYWPMADAHSFAATPETRG